MPIIKNRGVQGVLYPPTRINEDERISNFTMEVNIVPSFYKHDRYIHDRYRFPNTAARSQDTMSDKLK